MPRAAMLASPSPDVVQLFKVLADETRLEILRLLALTDLRVGEIVAHLGLPQNAVSYHLKQLRRLRLLRDHRSSADARDIYYSVDLDHLQALYAAAGTFLHPGMGLATAPAVDHRERPLRVLFLCTHNSARSQMAEAITRHLGGDQVEVVSARSEPTTVHPLTVELLDEWGIDTSRLDAKGLDRWVGQQFDYVITVCDRIRENCPTFPGEPRLIHWSIPDPVEIAEEEQRRRAFAAARHEISTRIRHLLSLPHPATGQRLQIRTRIPSPPG